MLERSLHFAVKPGIAAAWNARTVIIVALLDGSSTRVRDVATGEQHDAPVEELQGISAIGQIERKERRWAVVRDSTRAEWKQARRRERVLRKCMSSDDDSPQRIEFACKALSLSGRTIYRLSRSIVPQTTTLVQKHRGTPLAIRRLTATREAIATRCIELLASTENDGMAAEVHPASMDGSRLDFSPLSLASHLLAKQTPSANLPRTNRRSPSTYDGYFEDSMARVLHPSNAGTLLACLRDAGQ
jgi:hypothetical protein